MEILELVELPGKAGMSGETGKSGVPCKTHAWISRRSPCLLCVEFLFWNVVVLEELSVFCM